MFSNLQVNELTLAEFISLFSDPSDTSDTTTHVDNSIYSSLLSNLSDIHLDTATLQSLAFIGGYLHQLWKHFTPCNECMLYLTEDKYLHIEDPQHSKYKILELIDRGNLKWPSDIVLDAVVLVWKIFRSIEQNSMLLVQFANRSPRKTLVDLSIKWLEDAQCEHWRNQCHNCKLFGWDYLKKIITITSNCITANKVKNFNSIIVSQSRETKLS